MSYEKIDKMMQLWSGMKGPLFALDCMLTRPDFKNYCLQWNLFTPVRAGGKNRRGPLGRWGR